MCPIQLISSQNQSQPGKTIQIRLKLSLLYVQSPPLADHVYQLVQAVSRPTLSKNREIRKVKYPSTVSLQI